jgi:hypothetical protein
MMTDGVFLFSVPKVDSFVAWVLGRGAGGVIVTSQRDTAVVGAIYEHRGRLHIEVRVFEGNRPLDDAERHWTRPTGNEPAADAVLMVDKMFRAQFRCTRVDLIEAVGPDRSLETAMLSLRRYDDGRFTLSAGMVEPVIDIGDSRAAEAVLRNAEMYQEALSGDDSSVAPGYTWTRIEDLPEDAAGLSVAELPWGDTVVETMGGVSRTVWCPDLVTSSAPTSGLGARIGVLTEELDGIWQARWADGEERPCIPVRLDHTDGPVYLLLVDLGGRDVDRDAGRD